MRTFQEQNPGGKRPNPKQPQVQAKLEVGRPGDKFEREADAVADKVVDRGVGMDQSLPLDVASSPGTVQMQRRQNKSVQMERSQTKPVQMKRSYPNAESLQNSEEENSGQLSTSAEFESRLQSKRGNGKLMDENMRLPAEEAMAADLSQVNIHTDGEAVQMSKEVGAKAFTHGQDIFFNEGNFAPGTKQGDQLLAHELAHTVQQGGSPHPNKVQKKEGDPIRDYRASVLGNSLGIGSLDKSVGNKPGSYWKSMVDDHFGGRMSPYGTADRFTNSDRERAGERFSKYPAEQEALFYHIWNLRPNQKEGQEFNGSNFNDTDMFVTVDHEERKIIKLELSRPQGNTEVPYQAWYEVVYFPTASISYDFIRESSQTDGEAVATQEEIESTAKSSFTPKVSRIREWVGADSGISGLPFQLTFPAAEGVHENERQREYFKEGAPGAKQKETICKLLDQLYKSYGDEYSRVNLEAGRDIQKNKHKNKDEPSLQKTKKEAREAAIKRKEAIKVKLFKQLIEAEGILFYVEGEFKEFTGESEFNQKVEVKAIRVMYLGPQSEVGSLELPNNYTEKNSFDWKKESFAKNNTYFNVTFEGFETLPNNIRKEEELIVMEKAKNMLNTDKAYNTEIDHIIPINYGGEQVEETDRDYELVYYTFTSGSPTRFVDGQEIKPTVHVKRIGNANDSNSKHGDAEKLRLQDIYGYSPTLSGKDLVNFVIARYEKTIKKGDIEGKNDMEVMQKANNIISAQSSTLEWFKLNYAIEIMNESSSGEFMRQDILKTRFRYDSVSTDSGKERKMHPDIDLSKGKSETDGLKDWTPEELKYMEMTFQKFSPEIIKKLAGTKYFRQTECLLWAHYKRPAGMNQPHPSEGSTIMIYDTAFVSKSNVPYEKYHFRGDEQEVSSVLTQTLTHETGHVLQNLGPAGDTNGDRFYYFYSKIVGGDEHGHESTGITEYARGEGHHKKEEKDQAAHTKNEYFPEAYDLFMHDPNALYRSRPKVYMWFYSLQKKGVAPTKTTSTKFVIDWMKLKKGNNGEPPTLLETIGLLGF
jgi:hypothetical protein